MYPLPLLLLEEKARRERLCVTSGNDAARHDRASRRCDVEGVIFQ